MLLSFYAPSLPQRLFGYKKEIFKKNSLLQRLRRWALNQILE